MQALTLTHSHPTSATSDIPAALGDHSSGSAELEFFLSLTVPVASSELKAAPHPSWATAADIPSELHGRILAFVGRLSLNSNAKSHQGMKTCSLVCYKWTNKCRHHVFRDREIYIRSMAELDELHRYDVSGSPRLVPLRMLVKSVVLWHTPGDRMWYYYPFTSPIAKKPLPFWFEKARHHLHFRGERDPQAPAAARWYLPKSFPGSLLRFTKITLSDVSVYNLTHFLWSLRDLKFMETLSLRNVTWVEYGDPPARLRSRADQLRYVEAQYCTDNTKACLRVWELLNTTFLWFLLPQSERPYFFEAASSLDYKDVLWRVEYISPICFQLSAFRGTPLGRLLEVCVITSGPNIPVANIQPPHPRNLIGLFIHIPEDFKRLYPSIFRPDPENFHVIRLLQLLFRRIDSFPFLRAITIVAKNISRGEGLQAGSITWRDPAGADVYPVMYKAKRRWRNWEAHVRAVKARILQLEWSLSYGTIDYEGILGEEWEQYTPDDHLNPVCFLSQDLDSQAERTLSCRMVDPMQLEYVEMLEQTLATMAQAESMRLFLMKYLKPHDARRLVPME